ncbi:MAG: hypothetical protein RL748_1215 [Pseudomonadota bacterium]|jgi:uncharacterized protein (DUF1501 family)
MQRRFFLQAAASSSLLTLGNIRLAYAADPASGATTQPGKPGNNKKLIVVMLRGAADGLNIVAPLGDANYNRLRPGIALAKPGQENGALALDGYFGLHPALSDLMPLWQQKKLAFVHACGSNDTTRSHFDAQDYLESGTPGNKATADGWMNRLLTQLPGPNSPTRALAIGPVLPRILSGSATSSTIAAGAAGTRANLLDRPVVAQAFDQLYKNDARLGKTYQDAKAAHKDLMAAAEKPDAMDMNAADMGAPLPNGFPDDATRLARLMRNEPRIQMAFLALGGWDTHANQGAGQGQLAQRLQPLGHGLARLTRELGPLMKDTVIVVMSEFGRTARQNGNGGTDHGHGNVMWLLGDTLTGGKIHGAWPGLEAGQLYEGRDLAVSTDFRSVLGQVAQKHFALDETQLERVFPQKGLIKPAGLQLFA